MRGGDQLDFVLCPFIYIYMLPYQLIGRKKFDFLCLSCYGSALLQLRGVGFLCVVPLRRKPGVICCTWPWRIYQLLSLAMRGKLTGRFYGAPVPPIHPVLLSSSFPLSLSLHDPPPIRCPPLLVYLVLLLSCYSIVYRFGEADRTPIICNPSFLTLRCQVKVWWLRLGESCCSVIPCTYPALTLHLDLLSYLHYLHLDPVTLQ